MKLYATVKSERGKQASKGGNEYLESNFFITSRDTQQARVRVINDDEIGLVYFVVEEFFFGKWSTKYEQKYFVNVPEKGVIVPDITKCVINPMDC